MPLNPMGPLGQANAPPLYNASMGCFIDRPLTAVVPFGSWLKEVSRPKLTVQFVQMKWRYSAKLDFPPLATCWQVDNIIQLNWKCVYIIWILSTLVSHSRTLGRFTLPIIMKALHELNHWSFEPENVKKIITTCSSDLTGQSSIKPVTWELLAGEMGGGIIRANWSFPIGHLISTSDHCSGTCVSAYSSRNLISGNDHCSSIKEQGGIF